MSFRNTSAKDIVNYLSNRLFVFFFLFLFIIWNVMVALIRGLFIYFLPLQALKPRFQSVSWKLKFDTRNVYQKLARQG